MSVRVCGGCQWLEPYRDNRISDNPIIRHCPCDRYNRREWGSVSVGRQPLRPVGYPGYIVKAFYPVRNQNDNVITRIARDLGIYCELDGNLMNINFLVIFRTSTIVPPTIGSQSRIGKS